MYGLGATLPVGTAATTAACANDFAGGFFYPSCWFASIFPDPPSMVAPPPAPTGAALTTAPADAASAQALADQLAAQQLAAQKALNATQVQSTWLDTLLGNTAAAGGSIGDGIDTLTSYLPWVIGGVALFAMVAIGGGSPRRYGR
jgi:hypothetical protein